MVKLRLKRYGRKRQPSYRIIAIESKTRREGRPLEELGYYNPRTKETVLETAGLLKWLRCGAQPTDTVDSLLRKAGIYEMLKAGEGGVVATIRIPAVAKPEAGIPEPGPSTEDPAGAGDIPEASAQVAAERAGQAGEVEPVGAAAELNSQALESKAEAEKT